MVSHRALVSNSDYSQWKMAGFGMFSSIENADTRYVRVFAQSGACTVPQSLLDIAYRYTLNLDIDRRDSLISLFKHAVSIQNIRCPNNDYSDLYLEYGFIDFNMESHKFFRNVKSTWELSP
jgi:hypothetical protein